MGQIIPSTSSVSSQRTLTQYRWSYCMGGPVISKPLSHYYSHFSLTSNATGSFVEFLDIIPILATSKSPSFHIVVPSMPGYAFSSSPPLDQDFTFQDTAYLVNGLMVGLGLKGYIAQGGDIGSFVAKVLAAGFSSCRGEFLPIPP